MDKVTEIAKDKVTDDEPDTVIDLEIRDLEKLETTYYRYGNQ